MTTALLVALVATVLIFVWLLDRKDARAKAERDADREERQVLLQRIQAPEQAVYEHTTRDQPNSDGDGMPMTDQEIADEQARAAVQRILSMEQAEYDGRRI